MTWEKHGLVIRPTGDYWCRTHCMLPTPEKIGEGQYRIYFGGRNDKNQSHIGYADINLDRLEVSNYSKEPVLSPGPLGRFDDNGVLPSCVTEDGMCYIGFKPGGTTRMSLIAGFCEKKFQDRRQILSNDYGIATAPWYIGDNIYYVHGIDWLDKDTPRYNIVAFGKCVVIPLKGNEIALARPYVVKEDRIYKMFFSAKGRDELYRPQYSESKDGLKWERKPYDFPEANMCYMIVLKHNGKEYMFYNDAKDYGREGIKLAVRNA